MRSRYFRQEYAIAVCWWVDSISSGRYFEAREQATLVWVVKLSGSGPSLVAVEVGLLYESWAPIEIFPGRGKGQTTWRAREREPITGVWGGALSEVQGQSPWSLRGQGAKPPEAEHFEAFAHLNKSNFPVFRGQVLLSRGKCPPCPCLWRPWYESL